MLLSAQEQATKGVATLAGGVPASHVLHGVPPGGRIWGWNISPPAIHL